jgi:hypothetical protein
MRKGDRITVATEWGTGPTVHGVITGFGTNKGRPVVDYRTAGTERDHWCYHGQIVSTGPAKGVAPAVYTASLCNSAGEIDRVEAATVFHLSHRLAMLLAGNDWRLEPGDTIKITEEEEPT